MKEIAIKKRKTYDLRLTKSELLHLRDLFGIVLPPDATKTLSQALAELESRQLIETKLWAKISTLVEHAGLPVGDEAPDYVVAPSGTPPISVFQISREFESEDDEDAGGDE